MIALCTDGANDKLQKKCGMIIMKIDFYSIIN